MGDVEGIVDYMGADPNVPWEEPLNASINHRRWWLMFRPEVTRYGDEGVCFIRHTASGTWRSRIPENVP